MKKQRLITEEMGTEMTKILEDNLINGFKGKNVDWKNIWNSKDNNIHKAEMILFEIDVPLLISHFFENKSHGNHKSRLI